jgi:hypothetical protein
MSNVKMRHLTASISKTGESLGFYHVIEKENSPACWICSKAAFVPTVSIANCSSELKEHLKCPSEFRLALPSIIRLCISGRRREGGPFR